MSERPLEDRCTGEQVDRESEKPVRIAYLSNSSHLGGGERSLLLIARGVAGRGNEAIVVVPEAGRMKDAAVATGISVVTRRYSMHSWRSPLTVLRDTWSWAGWIRNTGVHLIHANDLSTARSLSFAARRTGVPLICHVRYPPDADHVKWCFRNVPHPNAFILNSYAMQRALGGMLAKACPRADQYVVHNAVDETRFTPPVSFRENPIPVIANLANLVPVKRHEDFFHMSKVLKDQGVDHHCWVIGEDVLRTGYGERLKQVVSDLAITDTVKFLGHVGDVPNVLREADLLVCTSSVEPFGRCLIEAMACGKAVVATRVGGIPEVVVDGITGMLVDPGRPAETASAVKQLLLDKALRKRMGAAGRDRALQMFSQSTHVDNILDVYRRVL